MVLRRRRGIPIGRVVAALLLLPATWTPGRPACAQTGATSPLRWSELPPLPDPVGFAGPFAGVSGGWLIVAGGANFPGGRPWDGHAKVWHDRVFLLAEPDGEWTLAPTRLPRPAAYGISVTWNDRVICIGGGDADEHFGDCFTLSRVGGDARSGADVRVDPLPPLPRPTAFACGAILGDVVYVMGGTDRPDATECLRRVLALDLAAPDDRRAWIEVDAWPGPERYLAVAGAQAGGLYLFGGIRLTSGEDGAPSRVTPFLQDAYRFAPDAGGLAGRWERVADLPAPRAAGPTPALALGPAHLALLGGDDGARGGAARRDAHPGFDDGVLASHTVTGSWTGLGRMPSDHGPDPAGRPEAGTWPPVTTTTVPWNGGFVVPTGEIRPGVRTTRVLVADPVAPTPRFGALNYAVIVAYLAALVLMGVYFSRRERTTGDFFLGGRRVPWWAAGISIFGTQLSAITFLAIPAKTYATDWVYFIQNMGIVAIAPLIVWMYLPFFRRLELTTAYEYLEHRFNVIVRLLGAISFVAFQLARMGIVMFLPALALAAVTGMDIVVCIVAMGVLCTVYTVLGGIEAVIWTDVLQVVVLLGGALLALAIIVLDVDGGVAGAVGAALDQDKLRLEWDWTGPALGVILLGAVFNNLVPYSSDQAVVQRYLTTKDERRAAGAVWAGALLAVPASIIFFGVGTALFVFYQQHPERLNPLGPPDQIFAWFIVQELPAGVAGLVVAGIFAAAMSSLDSSMNSVSAVITTDFFRRFLGERSERSLLALARWITVGLGVGGTATAVLMAQVEVQSLWDEFLAYVGLLGGTMAGLFALGIISTRATATGAIVGAAAAAAALVYVKTGTDLSGLAYAAVGMVTCVVVGYLASRVLPAGAGSVDGLTIHTMSGAGHRGAAR
jgi:SSS family transporter